jgi:protein-arginine kinase activator protein McsA
MPDDTSERTETTKVDLQEYTCERCGFKYHKVFDYQPYLCYKCMRFVAKRTVSIVRQVVPNYPKFEAGDV